MRHPFMEAIAQALFERGVATLRYEFPYLAAGRKRPDPPARLVASVREAVERARAEWPRLPLIAGGKSMGGRMTSTAQAEAPLPGVCGLIFLGFPLHPPGKPAVSRADHLFLVRVPMLFLQGSRDDFAERSLITGVCERLGSRATLQVIEGADHSFRVPKRKGEQVIGELADRVAGSQWSMIRGER
jgi:predicted alpha/beta-hydrolase family hydrolase